MRELKFRAWDGNSMRYDVTGFEHGCRNEMQGVFLDGEYFWFAESTPNNTKELYFKAEVMQYTGLQDANGVEIYEGDLIAPRHYPFYGDGPEIEGGGACKDLNYVGEIFWSEDDLGWAVGLHVVSDRVVGRACGGALYDYCDIETIGNIHENPELVNA